MERSQPSQSAEKRRRRLNYMDWSRIHNVVVCYENKSFERFLKSQFSRLLCKRFLLAQNSSLHS